MDAHSFLRSRRSVRRFTSEPITDSVIERILTTAAYAPSAHNLQPWRFVVVKNTEYKTKLARALTDKMRLDMQREGAPGSEIEKRVTNSIRRINEAPVIIMLCRDTTAVRVNTSEEIVMNIQSVALAGLQLLLAAHAEGLGGNWICWPLYAMNETQSALNLPKEWEPQAMIFVGYASDVIKDKTLKPITELMETI
jgi:F420 biosynthesis protein FbiB-like protein